MLRYTTGPEPLALQLITTPPWSGAVTVLAWLRVEEYSGLTGRKGTTVASDTRVLWFWVTSHTEGRIAGGEERGQMGYTGKDVMSRAAESHTSVRDRLKTHLFRVHLDSAYPVPPLLLVVCCTSWHYTISAYTIST